MPLALPDIMLGINQVLMMAFGMLVITALVGTRGLEHELCFSLGKVQPGRGIVSGLGIAFLSIVADRISPPPAFTCAAGWVWHRSPRHAESKSASGPVALSP